MPEKTESAFDCQLNSRERLRLRTYLGTTIARKLVVPKTLVRSLNGSLVVVMPMGVGRANKGSGSSDILHGC